MSRLITASERIAKARGLILQARALERSQEIGWQDFSYTAQVKDIMRQARELLKFIAYTSGISSAVKEEAKLVQSEIDEAEQELLHP